MKANYLRFCLILLAGMLVSMTSLDAQTTIYSEDFTGQPLQGFTGPVAANQTFTAPSGKWSVSSSVIQGIFDANDHARVEDDVVGFGSTTLPTGAAFQFRDVDEPTTWRSQVVDISNFASASLALDVFEIGSLESTDSTVVAYILDGVRTVIFRRTDDYSDADGTGSSSSSDPGNVNPVVSRPSASGLSGSTLQIEVTVDVNSSSELPHIDNVLIEGSGFTPPTCSFTFGSNSGTCNAFTSGTDTYTATFNFSGAGNGDYTVTSDFGTVVLDDDPDSDATGSFRVTGVPEGTDVTATVNGVNCTNITSTVTAPTCAQPAPGGFTLTSLSVATQLFPRITWTSSAGADSYTVELSVGGGAFEDRITVGNTVFAYTDTVPVFGQPITYRVRATNASGSTSSNTLTVTPPATIDPLDLTFNCFDPTTNELVWDVQNTNIQNIPFIYAQWFSPQRDTLIAPNRTTSSFRTDVNPQNPGTFGDDNITGIWWIDERLLPGEPNDLVFTIDLSQTCTSGRTSNPSAIVAPDNFLSGSVFDFLNISTNADQDILNGMITVGPNPFRNVLRLESSEIRGEVSLSLLDLMGRTVYQSDINFAQQAEIQLGDLSTGVYILNVQQGNSQMSYRVIKE
ncbi:MAG: T9SS type A sorting domain-containing protein [Bacteroidota bacterium]